ncbi:MAG: cytochrome c maturation protein CcmE [Chloroflexota bacterium]
MAQAAWEKPIAAQIAPRKRSERWKFLVGGALILAAVAYLVISGTVTGAQYFITVDDLLGNPAYMGQTVRITGAVIGDTIDYDADSLLIQFTVANISNNTPDLGAALHDAVINPNVTHLPIRVERTVKPELLQHEAQAIMTGTLGTDGIFHVSELLLKCPSRFIESGPSQGELSTPSQQQVPVGAGA